MDSIYFKFHCLNVFYFLFSTTENYLFFSGNIICWIILTKLGFPGGSDSKESTCKAGDQGSIPGLRRSPLEKEMAIHSMCPGVGPEGWLRWFLYPFGVQEACTVLCFFSQPLVFAPSSSEVAVRLFGSFCILLSTVCPNCECSQLFLVSYSFFVFCCLGRLLSKCKDCSKWSQSHVLLEPIT